MAQRSIIPIEHIDQAIIYLRGEKVLLDAHLAALYGIQTKRLIEAVKRHKDRFPVDFMFQLSKREFDVLRSQSATSSFGRGGRRYPPYAFTELGVAMLSSVLNSSRAVAVNIEIIRAFVRLRKMLASHDDLARKLTAMEKKYDKRFKMVFEALYELMSAPVPKKARIGFQGRGES